MNALTPRTVLDTGISPVSSLLDPITNKLINYLVPSNQDISSGLLHANPTEHSMRMADHARLKPDTKQGGKYDALKRMSPSLKPGGHSPVNLQAFGIKHQDIMLKRAVQPKARHDRFQALRAMPAPSPKSTPKPDQKPQAVASPMPQNLTMSVGQIAAQLQENVPSRGGLKQRMNYWSRGAACNLG